MVEDTIHIDIVFSSLADPVRRDILERVFGIELTVNEIAIEYDMSLAAVSKHLKILQQAGLISKRRNGRHIHVRGNISGMLVAKQYLDQYVDTSDINGKRI